MNPRGFILRMQAAQRRAEEDGQDKQKIVLHRVEDWGFYWSVDDDMYSALDRSGGRWQDNYEGDFEGEDLEDFLSDGPSGGGTTYGSFEEFVAAQVNSFDLEDYWDVEPDPDFDDVPGMINFVNAKLAKMGTKTRVRLTTDMGWGFLYDVVHEYGDDQSWIGLFVGKDEASPGRWLDLDADHAEHKWILEWAETYPKRWNKIHDSTLRNHPVVKYAGEAGKDLKGFAKYLLEALG